MLKESWGSNVLAPLYDNHDSVCGIEYNGSAYFFVKNLQGDVISIANSSGTVVARYTYDAWGACTVTSDTSGCNISAINPYRYRSYYYDTEIGLYYLQSRYYDPVVGRFICGDDVVFLGVSGTILGYNLFSYCNDNPVCCKDRLGYYGVEDAAQLVNANIIFEKFLFELMSSVSIGLLKISAYVTSLLLPKVTAIFWWSPWVIAGIIVGAIAIICVAIVVIYDSLLAKIRKGISNKIKTKDGKIDLGKFSKKPGSGPPTWIGPLGYELIKDMSEHKGPAYKLFYHGVRIATISMSGEILGK